MELFFWIFGLLIPLVITVMGFAFTLRPPKKINYIYGYRTVRSMASKEAWDYAHSIGGSVWLKLGPALIVLTVTLKLTLPVPPEILALVLLVPDFAGLIAPIPYVEKKLKEKFGK
jgi:uncharacterized membrane protein